MTVQELEKLVEAFESLGMKLTVTPLADGSLRLNRWRMINYWSHAREAEAFWTERLGEDRERLAALTNFVASRKMSFPAVLAV